MKTSHFIINTVLILSLATIAGCKQRVMESRALAAEGEFTTLTGNYGALGSQTYLCYDAKAANAQDYEASLVRVFKSAQFEAGAIEYYVLAPDLNVKGQFVLHAPIPNKQQAEQRLIGLSFEYALKGAAVFSINLEKKNANGAYNATLSADVSGKKKKTTYNCNANTAGD